MASTPHTARRPRDVDAAVLSRPHRTTLGVAAALILAEAVLELARPWPLKFVVDQGLGHQPFPSWAESLAGVGVAGLALLAGAAVVVLSVVGALASAGSALLVGRVAERIGTTLRGRLVSRMLDQPPAFFRRHRSAELVNRLTSDVRRVEDAVVAWWEVAVPEAVVLVGHPRDARRDRPGPRGDGAGRLPGSGGRHRRTAPAGTARAVPRPRAGGPAQRARPGPDAQRPGGPGLRAPAAR